MDQERFAQSLMERGIELRDEQKRQFETYYDALVEWNKKMNLTAIVEKEQVYVKHFFDSVSLSFFKDMHAVERLLDVGAGAGFPGLPLKICFPHLQVTIIDSLKKRITFLEHVTKAMGMRDITLHHGRAEEFGRNTAFRERFDLVTARAVARLNVLSEYCLPFVKIGGTFAAMKGSDAEAEIGEAEHAIRLLGGEREGSIPFTLPAEQAGRTIVFVRKAKPTPKTYPRKPGMPAKKPLT